MLSSSLAGRIYALTFAVAGLVVAACMLWVMGSFRLSLLRNIVQISPTVPFGALMVLVLARGLGGRFGRRAGKRSRWKAAGFGAGLSLSCLVLASIAGALVYLVTEWKRYEPEDVFRVLVGGPLAVAVYGFVPATALGVAYGLIVRRVVARAASRSTRACRP